MIFDEDLKHQDVCGVIITYNGESTIVNTLLKLKNNVKNIVIVDNYSEDKTIEIIRSLNLDNVYIVENKTNAGIASALNQGAEYAKKRGFSWILTMDQDSLLADNVLLEMIKVYSTFGEEQKKRIACLAPIPVMNERALRKKDLIYELKDYVITSGNLVKLEHLDLIGGYEEKLFIDSVDFDFCLKLNDFNLLIVQCTNAYMHHELGKLKKIKLFGAVFEIHLHSSLRKYYMSRNHIYILKRFFKTNKRFCIKKTFFFLLFLTQIILFESNKKKNLKAIFRGIRHGIEDKYYCLYGEDVK